MSSPRIAAKPVVLTYDDYCALPADGQRYEILDGELQATPAPSPTHQRVSRELKFLLHAYVKQHRLGEIFNAPIDVIFGRTTIAQPDLVFVPTARRGMVTGRGIEGAPELVVEIISPSTGQIDRGTKLQLYAKHGVDHYWILDPGPRSLTEYVLAERAYELRGTYHAPATCHSALFPQLALPLLDIFPDPPGAE